VQQMSLWPANHNKALVEAASVSTDSVPISIDAVPARTLGHFRVAHHSSVMGVRNLALLSPAGTVISDHRGERGERNERALHAH
jgi:hypothetical protein